MNKQKSDIAVLLDFAGSYKALTFVGLGLSAGWTCGKSTPTS